MYGLPPWKMEQKRPPSNTQRQRYTQQQQQHLMHDFHFPHRCAFVDKAIPTRCYSFCTRSWGAAHSMLHRVKTLEENHVNKKKGRITHTKSVKLSQKASSTGSSRHRLTRSRTSVRASTLACGLVFVESLSECCHLAIVFILSKMWWKRF